ncbi:MAG: hypothetical protein D4R73_11635 [Deltaproteobacteria bacterium]|nr:MAG: hypothetical protein D4R73_11635 [Deltaproteobacteria bacterium]
MRARELKKLEVRSKKEGRGIFPALCFLGRLNISSERKCLFPQGHFYGIFKSNLACLGNLPSGRRKES